MSNGNEVWLEKAEEMAIFALDQGDSGAGRMLEVNRTNRTIVTENQALANMTLRLVADRFNRVTPGSYKFLADIADMVERYQQTMLGETNSRIQFMKVATAAQTVGNRLKFELDNLANK